MRHRYIFLVALSLTFSYCILSPFEPNFSFLYPLKTSGNQRWGKEMEHGLKQFNLAFLKVTAPTISDNSQKSIRGDDTFTQVAGLKFATLLIKILRSKCFL